MYLIYNTVNTQYIEKSKKHTYESSTSQYGVRVTYSPIGRPCWLLLTKVVGTMCVLRNTVQDSYRAIFFVAVIVCFHYLRQTIAIIPAADRRNHFQL